ncbi:hypothetical protein FRB90_007118, partial [Tulasnella sp. 427]
MSKPTSHSAFAKMDSATSAKHQSSFPAYNHSSKRSTVIDDIHDPPAPLLSSSSSTLPAPLTSSIYGQSRRPPPASSPASARSGSEGVIPSPAYMSTPSSAPNKHGTIGDRRRSSARHPPMLPASSSPANLSHELDRSSTSTSTAIGENSSMPHIPSIVSSLCMSPNLDECYARLNPSLYPLSTPNTSISTTNLDISPNTSLLPSTSDGSMSASGSGSGSGSGSSRQSSLMLHIPSTTATATTSFRDSPPNLLHIHQHHPHLNHLRQTSSGSTISSPAATTPLLDSPGVMSSPGAMGVFTPKEDGVGQVGGADYFLGLEGMKAAHMQQKGVGMGAPPMGKDAEHPSRRPSLPGSYEGLGLNVGPGTGDFALAFGGPMVGGAYALKPTDGTTPTQASVSAHHHHHHPPPTRHPSLPSSHHPTQAQIQTASVISETTSTIAQLQAQIEELKLKRAVLEGQQPTSGAAGPPHPPIFPVPLPANAGPHGGQSLSIPASPTYFSLPNLHHLPHS